MVYNVIESVGWNAIATPKIGLLPCKSAALPLKGVIMNSVYFLIVSILVSCIVIWAFDKFGKILND